MKMKIQALAFAGKWLRLGDSGLLKLSAEGRAACAESDPSKELRATPPSPLAAVVRNSLRVFCVASLRGFMSCIGKKILEAD